MSEGFNAFKKRIIKEHLIKTTIIGVSGGLSIFGVLFLLSKREIINLKIWLLVLITLASVILIMSAYYFVKKPSDKKIARRLDKTFGLNEKVQTMLDYKDDNNNEIVILQREDTNHILKSIKLSSLRLSIHFVFYIMLVIGIGLSITSVSVPKVVHNSPVVPPVEVPETDIDKIKKLIKHVEASDIYEEMKTKYIAELNMLILELQSDGLTNERIKTYVYTTINNVLYYMSLKNVNVKYGKILYETDEKFYTPTIANVAETAFNSSFVGNWKCKDNASSEIKITRDKITYLGNDYEISSFTNSSLIGKITVNQVTSNVNLTLNLADGTISDGKLIYSKYDDFYRLKALGEGIYNYSINDIESVINNINDEFVTKAANSIILVRDKLALDIEIYKSLIENNQGNDDDIYNSLKTLYDSLQKASSASDSKKLDMITSAFDELYIALANVIPEMLENRNEAWYIEDTLREIFNLGKANREDDLSNGGGNTGSNDNEGNENFGNGGLGNGDYIFAAKDYFYDYDSGKWMAYGVFYNDYYSIIDSLIQDGTISEEMVQYVKDYFNKLLNGLNEDKDE